MAKRNFGNEDDSWDEEPDRIDGISAEELKALEEERTIMDESEVQFAQRILRENLVAAIRTVTNLALKSRDERIRMTAAQYVIERNMGRVQDTPPKPTDDPLAALMGDVVIDASDVEAMQKVAAMSAAKTSDTAASETQSKQDMASDEIVDFINDEESGQ